MQIKSALKGLKGFYRVYESALKYRYMIQDKALKKARVLVFWEKHGLLATIDAFKVSRRTLFLWQKQFKSGGRLVQALNEASKAPKKKRSRLWPEAVLTEIRRLRSVHPNLGKDKLYPELEDFCVARHLPCPSIATIGRLIKDLGGLRQYPLKLKLSAKSRKKRLRKPKHFTAKYPGHLVALDTIERRVFGSRHYVITCEDIHTRFAFAWATKSHASLAAREFFVRCRQVFPFAMNFVLTDNGSEFAKDFTAYLDELKLPHYHTYPRSPKMNAHCERFNRTIQEEFIDYHAGLMEQDQLFSKGLMDYLLWYNTRRVHHAFKNKLSPLQYLMSLKGQLPKECKMRWTHTWA